MRWFSSRRSAHDPMSAEVSEELDGHLALRIEANVAQGMTPVQAEAEARRRFGSRAAVESASLRIRRSDDNAWRSLVSDLNQAWMALRRSPGGSFSGLLVTAIGLATVLAAARVGDSLLVRPPTGVSEPGALHSVLDSVDGEHRQLLRREAFEIIRDAAPEARVFVWSDRDVQLIHSSGSRVVSAAFVSGDYFGALGTRPAAGRLLDSSDRRDASRLVVVSARLARAIGGAAQRTLGQELTINGQMFSIVGVAETGFVGIEAGHPVDIWLPVSIEPEVSTPSVFPDGTQVTGYWNTPGIGWLRGGLRVPAGDASRLADSLTRGVRAVEPDYGSDRRRLILDPRPWLSPFAEHDQLIAVLQPVGWAMLLIVALTSACLSGLFVGRLADRRQELCVRLALGAGRARLVRLFLTQLGIVVIAGAALGTWMSTGLLAIAGDLQLTRYVALGNAVAPVDARAVALMTAFAVTTAVLASIGPVLFIRSAVAGPIGAATRSVSPGNRFRRLLMVAQVAAGCALLAGAGLLTRSIDALQNQPLGFEPAAVAYLTLDPAGAGLDQGRQQDVVRALLGTPLGPTTMVAVADTLPFVGQTSMFVNADDSAEDRMLAIPSTRVAGPYFDALGVRLTAGRAFEQTDTGRPVAILSAPLAEFFWPDANPVGRTIQVGGPQGERHDVVGVVDGLRDATLQARPTSRLYLPFDERAEGLVVFARPRSADPATIVPDLATLTSGLDPRLVVMRSGVVSELAVGTIEQRMLFRMLTATIGLGSLVMVIVGVWGLSHTSLRRRWREFGVRQALGASRLEVARLALADARLVGLAGGAIGIAGGWQFGRLFQHWLFGIEPHDPVSLLAAAALVSGAAVVGAIWPARQAVRIDPSDLLRHE